MTKDEALKLALEALEAAYARIVTKCEQNLVTYNGVDVDTLTLSQEAITVIKEALAQPEQEPMHPQLKAMLEEYFDKCFAESAPQRTWVGLTDEEIDECFEFIIEEDAQAIKFARAIEAKLKEKNT